MSSYRTASRGAVLRNLTALAALAGCGLGAVGCANSPGALQPQGDGTYVIDCKLQLSKCLKELEETCASYGYDVLDAHVAVSRYGPEQLQTEAVRTHALVKCRSANALISFDSDSDETPNTTPTAPVSACVPGASQACTGSGGCTGGQSCSADGSGYLPCDCGASGAENPASPPVNRTPTAPASPPSETDGAPTPSPSSDQPPTTVPAPPPSDPVAPAVPTVPLTSGAPPAP